MTEPWIDILKTKDRSFAELIKSELIANNIQAVVFDKIDASYPIFGEVFIKIQEKNRTEAGTIIAQHLNQL